MRPRSLSDRLGSRSEKLRLNDGFVRETFKLPVEDARRRARAYLAEFPVEAYMTMIERFRPTADGGIEFTMRRLPTAD